MSTCCASSNIFHNETITRQLLDHTHDRTGEESTDSSRSGSFDYSFFNCSTSWKTKAIKDYTLENSWGFFAYAEVLIYTLPLFPSRKNCPWNPFFQSAAKLSQWGNNRMEVKPFMPKAGLLHHLVSELDLQTFQAQSWTFKQSSPRKRPTSPELTLHALQSQTDMHLSTTELVLQTL